MSIKSVEWYTPEWIFERLGLVFDLDPASPFDFDTFVPASTKYTQYDDGLSKKWFGRFFLNPPYGKDTKLWMDKMISHRNGIALVFSRTDTDWCQKALEAATAVLFIRGRISFVAGVENQHKKSRSGAATVIFAFGYECAEALRNLGDKGFYISYDGWRGG